MKTLRERSVVFQRSTNHFFYIILSVIMVLGSGLMGCEGPEGPTGPQGPQGEQGTQGPQGEEGTANVIYSDWTSFDSANWSEAYTQFGQMRRDYPIDESAIDEEIMASGTVMVYVRIPGNTGDTIFVLPWVLHITKGLQQMLNFEIHPGQIVINFFDLVDDSVDPGTFGDNVEYRYIIIPGGTSAKTAFPDFNDYYAVMEYYGIDP